MYLKFVFLQSLKFKKFEPNHRKKEKGTLQLSTR